MLPETMTCVEISTPGAPEVLKPVTRPLPSPKAGEVLIKVAAAGINRPDVLQRAGAYPAPPGASDLPGLEVAGTIAALGEGAASPALGSRVCALAPGGGYAEYCTVDARHCLPIPAGYDMIRAAALPETFFTVWHNVVERGQLKAGERFLVHGGAGGIGTTAIQLAKALGATVFATANGEAKGKACRDLGADFAIDYSTADFVEVIKAETKGKGVDVILDMVGGDYIARNIKSLAADGRLVSIAFLRGSSAEINLMPVMLKRLTLTGSTLRPQSNDAKARMARGLAETVWPLLDKGAIAPLIHAVFPLAEAAKAHALMESNAHMGKIVLQV
ncbi:NAD(P)H-quinone oxidoreductase [Paramagnetospirillum magneticum]|uniref:NADPH:quinone reductase and related Zn-dependent oxidoreductase n=1 Tax=Paramagnetospirillum magneticum (strain ATCC 700264 / AMB-1) TaxID=342108 RepID=Q2W3U2_PARM1|nr:NAD(P)H-quinone oxidoreductase [Paramagnetospirillum magneticum]BAE51483.1 NADPH:quinone reductase and related Zn-dependent oxidoreductase [Paramagnetospirillum magneticum AMB-1]